MKNIFAAAVVLVIISFSACNKLRTPTEVPESTPTPVMVLYTDVSHKSVKGFDALGVTRTVNADYEFYTCGRRKTDAVFPAIVKEGFIQKLGYVSGAGIFVALTETSSADYNSVDLHRATGRMVYSAAKALWHQLFIIKADGTGNTQITYTAGNKTEPYISPDGLKLAFIEDEKPFFCNYNGSGKVELTIGSDYKAKGISWSPDGQQVALTVYDTVSLTYKVLKYRADNSQSPETLAETSSVLGAIYWHDSNTVYYDKQELSTVNIWKVNADASGNTRITYQGVGDWATLSFFLWD